MATKRVSLKGKGADIFFGDYAPANPTPAVEAGPTRDMTGTPAAVPEVPIAHAAEPLLATALEDGPRRAEQRVADGATVPDLSTPASTRASKQPSKPASVLASKYIEIVETIRKTVRTPGKEVSFVRLTPGEKERLAEIVYTYKRRGWKTSENEINRIAVNFILEDHASRGEDSLLAQAMEAIHG